jgi:ubiquitin C-terminal hydrolase
VIHSGTSEGGHYYSIIKFGDDWYRFDDENVSKVGFEDLKELSYGGKMNNLTFDKVHSTNAYILFY